MNNAAPAITSVHRARDPVEAVTRPVSERVKQAVMAQPRRFMLDRLEPLDRRSPPVLQGRGDSLSISTSNPLRKTRYPLAARAALCSSLSATPPRGTFPGGAFDGGDRLDEHGRVELTFDPQGAAQVEWRDDGEVEARDLQDRVDVLDRLHRLDQHAASDIRTHHARVVGKRGPEAGVGGERPPSARPGRRIRQICDAPLHVLRRPDERIDDPSAPASRAALTSASSMAGTRTSGEQAVPAVAAIIACIASRPIGPCSRSITMKSAPAAAIAWAPTAEGITHITPRRTLVIAAQPLLEEHRHSVAGSPSSALPTRVTFPTASCISSMPTATPRASGASYAAGVSSESKPLRRVCSITDALSIVGDRYALLVAREIRYGNTRFQGIAAGTGRAAGRAHRAAPQARTNGSRRAPAVLRRPPRHEYLLTDAGKRAPPHPPRNQGVGRPPRQPRRRADHLPTHLRRRLPPPDRLRRMPANPSATASSPSPAAPTPSKPRSRARSGNGGDDLGWACGHTRRTRRR